MNAQVLEKKIRGKMSAIKRKEATPKDSGIAALFALLKAKDEALYEELVKQYKEELSFQ